MRHFLMCLSAVALMFVATSVFAGPFEDAVAAKVRALGRQIIAGEAISDAEMARDDALMALEEAGLTGNSCQDCMDNYTSAENEYESGIDNLSGTYGANYWYGEGSSELVSAKQMFDLGLYGIAESMYDLASTQFDNATLKAVLAEVDFESSYIYSYYVVDCLCGEGGE